MKFRALGVFAFAVAVIGSAAVGCSSTTSAASSASSGNCPAAGTKACPMDKEITQADVDKCNQSKGDAKCGAAYVDVLKCAGNNVSCDAAGKADSSKFSTACKTQIDAFTKCLTAGAGGDAGR